MIFIVLKLAEKGEVRYWGRGTKEEIVSIMETDLIVILMAEGFFL
jgi:hypothetical protein